MKAMSKLAFGIIVVLFTACSTMKQNVRKNDKFTEKIVSDLYRKNGNAFYLRSTYATFSTVWSYSNKSINIFKLANGRIIDQNEYPNIGVEKIKAISREELFELDRCMELDGGLFGFWIKRDDIIEKNDLPIGIECFMQGEFESEFLNKVVNDINAYNMWTVRYSE